MLLKLDLIDSGGNENCHALVTEDAGIRGVVGKDMKTGERVN